MRWFHNPLIRRYCRSQIRPIPATLKAVTVLIVTSFFFLVTYLAATKAAGLEPIIGARMALIPVLALQCFILMIIGTAATTLGYVREVDEGMTDYQRLTPLGPLTKTLGYLFGLPIYNYALVGMTMPFVLFSKIVGEIPLYMLVEVYLSLFCSAVLYHLTGIVAGTILKRRLLASLVSMALVFCINVILPLLLSQTGYQFLAYITVWPVVQQHTVELIIQSSNLMGEYGSQKELIAMKAQLESVPFFSQTIHTLYFCLIIQGTLIATFILILTRRWRNAQHHLLSKGVALLLCIWLLTLFIGSAFPLIESGQIFPSRSSERFGVLTFGVVTFYEGFILAGGCGLVTLSFASLLIGISTPARDTMVWGLRRAIKSGKQNPPVWSDAASSLWATILISLLCGLAWYIFTRQVFGSTWLEQFPLPAHAYPVMGGVFLISTLCIWGALAYGGKRLLGMGILFVWIVPVMLGIIVGIVGQPSTSAYVAAPSVVVAFFASLLQLYQEVDGRMAGSTRNAIWIWLPIHLVIAGLLIALNWQRNQTLRTRMLAEEAE